MPGVTARVTSELLLVGSLPTPSAEEAFRAGAGLVGDLVPALPDGESGPLGAWVAFDRTQLLEPHPDIEVLVPSGSPTGRARHAYETARLAVRPGVETLRFERWPRVPVMLESYALFRRLRDEGVIGEQQRFQVNFPGPSSVFTGAFKDHYARDWDVVGPALEDLTRRSLEEVLAAIPARDLAVQFDCAYEVLDNEQVLGWTEGGREGAWDRFAGPWSRLAPHVPEDVLLGLHLCYGTFPEWPMFEARDMGLLVHLANHAAAHSGRPLDWLHLAGPRYLRSEDEAFFAPLAGLHAPHTRVFLGIVLPLDGEEGLRRRHRTASRYLADFGVAMYCGFGRQPGQDPADTLREHAAVVRAVVG
jgi:hypothetical protein